MASTKDVPARLGLEAPALARSVGAPAFQIPRLSQGHSLGLGLAWPGFRLWLFQSHQTGLSHGSGQW